MKMDIRVQHLVRMMMIMMTKIPMKRHRRDYDYRHHSIIQCFLFLLVYIYLSRWCTCFSLFPSSCNPLIVRYRVIAFERMEFWKEEHEHLDVNISIQRNSFLSCFFLLLFSCQESIYYRLIDQHLTGLFVKVIKSERERARKRKWLFEWRRNNSRKKNIIITAWERCESDWQEQHDE